MPKRRWILPVAVLAAAAVVVAGLGWLDLRRGTAPGTQLQESSLVTIDDAASVNGRTITIDLTAAS